MSKTPFKSGDILKIYTDGAVRHQFKCSKCGKEYKESGIIINI